LIALALALTVVACEQKTAYQPIGEEVFPAEPVDHAALYRMDALPVSPAFFRDHWTWVAFGLSECSGECQAMLSRLNSRNEGQALFVVTDMADHQRLRELGDGYPNVALGMGVTAMSYDLFASQFAPQEESERLATLFLVDPQGQVVYRLPAVGVQSAVLDLELVHARELAD
jgi:hypothetical protein